MQLSTPPIIKHLLHCFISKYKNVDRFPVCEWEDREYKKRKQKREGRKEDMLQITDRDWGYPPNVWTGL